MPFAEAALAPGDIFHPVFTQALKPRVVKHVVIDSRIEVPKDEIAGISRPLVAYLITGRDLPAGREIKAVATALAETIRENVDPGRRIEKLDPMRVRNKPGFPKAGDKIPRRYLQILGLPPPEIVYRLHLNSPGMPMLQQVCDAFRQPLGRAACGRHAYSIGKIYPFKGLHGLEYGGGRWPARARRSLQSYVLDFLYNHPTYRRLSFYGGTCLHVVYELNRLSEGIDFDNSAGVDMTGLGEDLLGLFRKTLEYEPAEVKIQPGGSGILRATLELPVLNALRLSGRRNEALHLKVEISRHKQVAVLQHTPVFYYSRSFVPALFSLETMMAGKIIACLERNFQRGRGGAFVKGRDYYDLLWFMQRGVRPLEEKLARDGTSPYTAGAAMQALRAKAADLSIADLAVDLLPMFESRAFIEAWLEGFHANFDRYAIGYIEN
jgi:predicted nucleotidyltransferase component of viral defense system